MLGHQGTPGIVPERQTQARHRYHSLIISIFSFLVVHKILIHFTIENILDDETVSVPIQSAGDTAGIKTDRNRVPIVAQRIKSQHSVHENVGSIPGLAQQVKDPVLPQAELADAAQIRGCCGCWPLAEELPYVAGLALKKNKGEFVSKCFHGCNFFLFLNTMLNFKTEYAAHYCIGLAGFLSPPVEYKFHKSSPFVSLVHICILNTWNGTYRIVSSHKLLFNYIHPLSRVFVSKFEPQ